MEMRFSEIAENLAGEKNPLYRVVDELRTGRAPIIDLVKGNVNEHGMVYPGEVLGDILGAALAESRIYRPDSFGQAVARHSIADYYGSLRIPPEQILITPGTSVSYWYCFRLLAEAGDEILTPQPSYPLFDYIARLCGIRLTPYRLLESQDWTIDFDHMERQIGPRTRAIVLISPHNPTGMVADERQLARLAEIAEKHHLPIIADEVFSEFLFGLDSLPRPATTKAPLVFTLNGFSKMLALPGMKLGWMAVTGDPALVRKSMAALEMISDTFLPVNEMVQFAVPAIFSRGVEFRKKYRDWVQLCFERAMSGLTGLDFVRPRGGFYVTVPLFDEEEKTATDLLRDHGILTHPGFYYDIEPNHLVMTFIHEPRTLATYFRRIGTVARMNCAS